MSSGNNTVKALEQCSECSKSHEPNAVTKRALEEAQSEDGLEAVDSVEQLLKVLSD